MSKNNMEGIGVPKGPVAAGFQRNSSMDAADSHYNQHQSTKPGHPLPPYPRGYNYPHYSRPPHPIKSVVTTSFEEREDGSTRHIDHHGGGSYHPHEYAMRGGRSPSSHGRDEVHKAFEPPHHGREPPHHGREPPHHGREPPHHGREPSPLAREPSHHGREPAHYNREPTHFGRELPTIREENVERRHPPHDVIPRAAARVPPSPSGASSDHPPPLHRSSSTGGPLPSPYRGQGPLKRSFWHHARSASAEEYQSLPNEFLPPKRSKIGSGSRSREYIVTARPHHDEGYHAERQGGGPPGRSPGWFNRAMSWEASRDEYYHREPSSKMYTTSWSRSPPYREGSVGPHWSDAPSMPSPRTRYSPNEGSHFEISSTQSWGHSSRWHHPEEHPWGLQHRDESESNRRGPDPRERDGYDLEMRRQGTFESSSDGDPPIRFIAGPPHDPDGSHRRMAPPGPNVMSEYDKHSGQVRLLALPDDRISLSETLCLVRENIEVFTATLEDVEAPAPGRKHAVVIGQVGLRCIHCRHTTRSSERVKRAVCYPSSIKRIYRTVIDMKLDHFLHCKFVPENLKETLNALKANNTRSTGTTMQYFIKAAGTLGMVDGPSGVRLIESEAPLSPLSSPNTEAKQATENQKITPDSKNSATSPASEKDDGGDKRTDDFHIHRNNSMSSENTSSSAAGAAAAGDDESIPKELFTGKITLALPEDKMSLSPLRCFLREQVCAFSATEEDIAVRTPTTFSVSIGQVGIGCVHCLNQPAKLRLNRAVCFPFSIARIYQSVADIQRFHLGECKMVPSETKSKFLELQSASSKGSKGLATRQYWVTSAKKIGLVDTPKGIRFGRDPSLPEKKSVSLDILAQVASNVNTVNRPLVLPEDKPYIAEFLYVVMEQLQACRFTEADRNKRRLKDVGCIGVECKHCAGQVDSRKFFWSSVNAVESNFVSVHTHMMECRMIPDPLKEKLGDLKKLRKEQTAALKTGSQKAFFSRVWKRLHGEEVKNDKDMENCIDEMSKDTVDSHASDVGSPVSSPVSSPKASGKPTVSMTMGDPEKSDNQALMHLTQSPRNESIAEMDLLRSPKKEESTAEMDLTESPKKGEDPTPMDVATTPIKAEKTPESPSSEKLKIVSDKMAVVSV